MKKKWISILIAVTLVVTMIPSVSLAAEPETSSEQQSADQRQAPYEVGYNSTDQIVEVPYEALGTALNGKDMYSAQVLDHQGETLAELKGKKNKEKSVICLLYTS